MMLQFNHTSHHISIMKTLILHSDCRNLKMFFFLGEEDMYDIDPIRANFLKQIRDLVKRKQKILQDHTLSPETRAHQIQNLCFNHASGPVLLEDLALTFTYSPSSSVFGFQSYNLVPSGADIEVNIENIEEYAELTTSFYLDKGIARQLEAFHKGFSMVFPMEKLAAFSPDEVRIMLCGDQNPEWTREDLVNYTEPKLGYTKERFVEHFKIRFLEFFSTNGSEMLSSFDPFQDLF